MPAPFHRKSQRTVAFSVILCWLFLLSGVAASGPFNPLTVGVRAAFKTFPTIRRESNVVNPDEPICGRSEISTTGGDLRRNLTESRGGAAPAPRPLLFWETMICGAISRSTAQTALHPANTMKTLLQNARPSDQLTIAELIRPKNFHRLTVGAGANFVLSVPHGAVNFAVLELIRRNLQNCVNRVPVLKRRGESLGPGLDFVSSCLSTVTCSVVSTPQMMVTDNIMSGRFGNLPEAIRGLASEQGIRGFYRGWWPGLAGKIPSYALTWTFFQQLKRIRDRVSDRPARDLENSALGCIASTTTVCIMIPMDTIKTRLVTQVVGSEAAYKGVADCAVRILREEGIRTFYRGLAPRLISVVPMIGIQFGIYEAMKKFMLSRDIQAKKNIEDDFGSRRVFAEAAMEVAASQGHPYPAPHFLKRFGVKKKRN